MLYIIGISKLILIHGNQCETVKEREGVGDWDEYWDLDRFFKVLKGRYMKTFI